MEQHMSRQPALEDIGSDYQQIAELIGMDNFLRLVEQYGGYQLYIPKYEGLFRSTRDEEIRASYNGYNVEALARKYNLTTRHIRYIVAPVFKQVKARPVNGQIGWFGDSASNILPEPYGSVIMKQNIETNGAHPASLSDE
jgi:hypothetical protein